MKKSNKDLKKIYENAYASGKENFFTFGTLDITDEIVNEIKWQGLSVLEIGCGIGDTASAIAKSGASSVFALDYSQNAINTAKNNHRLNNLVFEVGSLEDINSSYDCIIMQEVIEHVDNPFKTIRKLNKHLNNDGHMILTCPSFLNMRGYVWMTLQLLFDVPMSLSDKHFISPFDMENWASELDLKLSWRTFRHEQAYGSKMIIDMEKRLRNALKDAEMDNSKVEDLLMWLKSASDYESNTISNGAKGFYHFKK